MSQSHLNLGHPVDRHLASLGLVEHSVEAQLEFEHRLLEKNQREIMLARCFPEGKLVLRGTLNGLIKTVDPEVIRTYLIQDGVKKAIIYINTLRKVCIAIDWKL
jgi:hypothetical protein